MALLFADYCRRRLFGEAEDDPAAQWRAMRQNTPGLGDRRPVSAYRQAQVGPPLPPESPRLAQPVVDALAAGFKSGGAVPEYLVRGLGLFGKNASLVADSLLYAGGRAYPFYREKRAGAPTGRIMFVIGYPVDAALRALS